jgi:hypothetical protein
MDNNIIYMMMNIDIIESIIYTFIKLDYMIYGIDIIILIIDLFKGYILKINSKYSKSIFNKIIFNG